MGRRVNASFCDSDFLRGNRFSRLATCCGSRGNANNVIARLGTDTIIDPATRWRGEAIKPAQLQVIENVDVAVSVAEKI